MSASYSYSGRIWQMVKHSALPLLLVSTPLAAWAVPQEYTILAVGVADSQTKSEALAMDYAVKRALFLSATKMGVSDVELRILALTPEQLATVVRGTTVDKTRRGADRTYQEIRVTIAEDVLRPLMEQQPRTAVAQTAAVAAQTSEPAVSPPPARGILVVPALISPERTYLWEKENSLRAPLGDELLKQSRGLVMLPSGDLQDLRLIDPANAQQVKSAELESMFARYGVEEVIVALVSPGAEGTSSAASIILHRVGKHYVRNETMDVPASAETDKPPARLASAARAIATAAVQIANSTAEVDQQRLAKATRLPVLFSYSTPKELAQMSAAMRSAPQVLQLDMPQIALRTVKGVAYVEGKDLQAVRTHLTQRGVILSEQGGSWNLSVH